MFWIHICEIENQPHHQKTFTFCNDTTSHWIRNFFVLCDLIWKWIQKQIDMFFKYGVNSGIITWNSGINHSDFYHKVFNYRYKCKVVIILKAMAFVNLSTKNSNRGRKNYLPMIRSRSVNKFLFSVTYEAH